MKKFPIVSLFTGCGGLDLGFEKAGFDVVWMNEFDKVIWDTIRHNFPKVPLDTRSVSDVPSSDIPDAIGIIGGPPCQSWSEAGAGRGIKDERGQLFFEFIRILRDKQPLFFLAENVSGILAPRHSKAFKNILKKFEEPGYNVSYKLLNANDYNVPQDRRRVIVVGYRKDLGIKFDHPKPVKGKKKTLRDAIWGMPKSVQAKDKNKTNADKLKIDNHEHMNGGFSTIYMSRNRVRSWDEPSFTIQAGGRHAPIHPQANKMIFKETNRFVFDPKSKKPYRRLSVREAARVQTFPDKFIFEYTNIGDGYKMVGNAVPVEFACHIAEVIKADIVKYLGEQSKLADSKKEKEARPCRRSVPATQK